ncbi:MAG: Na+/H+ antiporter NhaA [Chitinophagaceae bacterium]|jgi:NhaA family Na+:H+ antiporter|nr:Na+/H+ antiporter NhaA [Chitinophagaceae bacterium]MCA6514591.1 Na+/H+ antiporter NhaA [Chitinophagaceae bacterium]
MRTIKKKSFSQLLHSYLHSNRSIGITLLLCTAISLLLANLSLTQNWYQHFWHHSLDGTAAHHTHLGWFNIPNSPSVFINDFLMAVFFFLAGMEIKREFLTGELSSIRQSLLPMVAAVGGMLMPAILFAFIARGSAYMQGWAIPTATDIAFTLGVISLLGRNVPSGLKIFVTALAIIDDLGAILVIAIFYGDALHWGYLLVVLLIVGILVLLNKRGFKFGWVHILLGLIMWYCMFNSGIHATVAGVIFAFLVPVHLLKRFEDMIHIPVYFIILPAFALANTNLVLPEHPLQALTGPLSTGIMAGLVIGKPLGISLSCYFLVSRKWAQLPSGVNWYKLIGAGILAGIGFTMSIFISALAFSGGPVEDMAKISVLVASLLAMLIGYCWLKMERTITQLWRGPSYGKSHDH